MVLSPFPRLLLTPAPTTSRSSSARAPSRKAALLGDTRGPRRPMSPALWSIADTTTGLGWMDRTPGMRLVSTPFLPPPLLLRQRRTRIAQEVEDIPRLGLT